MFEIRRSGNLLEIPDGAVLAPHLDALLSYTHKVGYQGQELATRIHYKKTDPSCPRRFNPYFDFIKRCLYQVRGQSLLCPAGLKTRITDFMTRASYPFNYVDLRSHKLPFADFKRLLDIPDLTFRYRQDEVLKVIDESEGGIIVAPTGFGKGTIIGFLAKCYPTSRIMVISPGKDLLFSTYERLLRVVPGDVGRIGGGFNETDARVTLCSADSLHKAHMDKQDLILYDEVHTAGTDRRISNLCRFTNGKFIGFSASFPARGDGADDLISSIFGPVLLKINYSDAADHGVVTPICALFVDVPPISGYVNLSHGAAWERKAYWRNDIRNEVIADSVKMIPQWLKQTDPQILIMVSKLEHGYELRKRLPDFTLIYSSRDEDQTYKFKKRGLIAEEGEDELSSKERTKLRLAFEAGTLRKVISTYCWKQGVDFCQLNALVRADGGDSDITNTQVPGRLSRLDGGKEYGLLVDLNDRFDQKAQRLSSGRFKHYEKEHGWQTRTLYNPKDPVDFQIKSTIDSPGWGERYNSDSST